MNDGRTNGIEIDVIDDNVKSGPAPSHYSQVTGEGWG